MTFQLASYGAVFSTRPLGAKLRDQALSERHGGDVLTISFAGVQSVSYSFADEFLGPIMVEGKANLTDVPEQLQGIILGALERRGMTVDESEIFSICA
jgi:hypothetical protein